MRFTINIKTPPTNTVAPPPVNPGSQPLWKITIDGGGKNWLRELLCQDDGGGGLLPFPNPTTLAPGENPPGGLCALPPADVLKVYEDIVARRPGRIKEYGRYLFDALLGDIIWGEIVGLAKASGDQIIELALSWLPTDGNLSRLHWEMMYDGSNFLAAGHLLDGVRMIDVAITRVIPDTTAVAVPVSESPRVLFVIGASLSDPSIRPGAEIMGLLRDPEVESRIRPRVLENASPKQVMRNMGELEPEVVHFICHGDFDRATKTGYIKLKADPGDQKTDFFAPNIWQWLSVAGKPPQIVVLSACKSGTALSPHTVAPLASELVSQGIPVVIAMSGKISDQACRLFTRRFGLALTSGETLVMATAKGRRAALAEGDAATRSVDWGFPTLYLSSQVSESYAPGVNAAASGGSLSARLVPYLLRREKQPVFCGRQEFFDAYYQLFENSGLGAVLAAYTQDNRDGYGRTRLLEELTIQALRDGHVPCAILASDKKRWSPPQDAMEFALRIEEAVNTARESLGLERVDDGPVNQLRSYKYGLSKFEELQDWLRVALRRKATSLDFNVTPYAISKAIERQFMELMAEARDKAPKLVGSKSRAILLLDEMHQYFEKFDSIAYEMKTGAWGFGTANEPVPIIMAFSLGTESNDLLIRIAESKIPNWRPLPLGPFTRDPQRPEDMRAYAHVLMNPFDKTLVPNYSDRAWFMDYDVMPDTNVQICEEHYRAFLNGLPGEFTQPIFYSIAFTGRQLKFLQPATDEDALRKLLQDNAEA